MPADGLEPLLAEQVAYYRARAPEYEKGALDVPGGDEVEAALRAFAPGGRVFFADDAYRTPDELVEGEASPVIRRRLTDGTAFRAVKVPHTPHELETRLARLGWDIRVSPTPGPFYWGAGRRAT